MEQLLNSQILSQSKNMNMILKEFRDGFSVVTFYLNQKIPIKPIELHRKPVKISEESISWSGDIQIGVETYQAEVFQQKGSNEIDFVASKSNGEGKTVKRIVVRGYNGETGDKLADKIEVSDFANLILLEKYINRKHPVISRLITRAHRTLQVINQAKSRRSVIPFFGLNKAGICHGSVFQIYATQTLGCEDITTISVSQLNRDGEEEARLDVTMGEQPKSDSCLKPLSSRFSISKIKRRNSVTKEKTSQE